MKNIATLLAGAAIAAASVSVHAQTADGVGQVRRLDFVKKEVTIKQDAIEELSLPAATLTYKMTAEALEAFAPIKPGDMVKFKVQQVGDAYVVLTVNK